MTSPAKLSMQYPKLELNPPVPPVANTYILEKGDNLLKVLYINAQKRI